MIEELSEVSYKTLGEDYPDLLEGVYDYINKELGLPQLGPPPRSLSILDNINLAINTTHMVEFLQGGLMLGMGWKTDGSIYDHPILARSEAHNRCESLGAPTRVLIYLNRWKEYKTVCIFFKEDGKVFACLPVPDGKNIIRQEVLNSLDENGGEITLEELEDFEIRLGTQNTFKRVAH